MTETETVLTNARLILGGEVVPGSVVLRAGRIASVDHGASRMAGALDCAGDYLAPGLIELHTDNLERHLQPRPGVQWPRRAAVLAHDAELAATGITTVFDALRAGSIVSTTRTRYGRYARGLCTDILDLRAAGALKISHFIHLRAEICSETLEDELAEFGPADRVRILSLMDHTPGQRQFADMTQLRTYLAGKFSMSEAEIDAHIAFRQELGARVNADHEALAVRRAGELGAILASHDDTTAAHVARSHEAGVALAEFPTTRAAAAACRTHGIAVMMGAPNVVRGGSHSGNVAASDLAREGLLDILSSDYVPSALLSAAVQLGEETGDLARGIATVTRAPAAAAGFDDRGTIAPGLRADLVRFALIDGVPAPRGTWVQGRRVG